MSDPTKMRSRDFEWCIVGNIVDKHYYGQQKELRRGSKHFGTGTKVYIFPDFVGMGHEKVRVMGKGRRSFRMIEVVMSTKLITDIRPEKVFAPHIWDTIASLSYYKMNKQRKNETDDLDCMADILSYWERPFEENPERDE